MKLSLLFALCATGLFAATETVIQNGTILTVTKGTYKGSVLIGADGKIKAVGEKINVPSGAKVIDATGQYVMPGIIDCHSHIAADSINEGSVSVSSMVGIEDVLNSEDISIYRALAGGVTTANILHGSANSIGGKCSVVKMRWGKSVPEMLFEGSKPGIKFALGENPKRRGSAVGFGAAPQQPRYPATRLGVEDVIREAFQEARSYQKNWQNYNARKAKGEQVIPPAVDLKLEPLVEVLEGKRLVHAHCYRQDEILMLLRVADEFGFKIRTLQHVLEGYKVAKEIAAHGAGASTFSDWYAYKIEANDAIPYNAALMAHKGVLVSLNSDSGELMRHLNAEAAKAMHYGGLTEDEALALVTINPAKQLMIDDKVGSLEVGKSADIAIFDAHPLSNFAKVDKVFIDGEMYFERAQDLARRPQLEAQKKSMLDRERAERPRPAGGRGGTQLPGSAPDTTPLPGTPTDRQQRQQERAPTTAAPAPGAAPTTPPTPPRTRD